MKQILVYADSLTWGIIPMTRQRFAFHQRWPGLLELALNTKPYQVRVIEDCLNGRRTIYEDPIRAGRNGLLGLQQRIEINSPLDLVMFMLGTNDFQINHQHTAQDAQYGMRQLIQAVRSSPVEPGMPIPEILVIAPPPILQPQGDIAAKFSGAEAKCAGLAQDYQSLASELQCHFFDAASVTTSSKVDGVHFDADQHEIFAKAIIPVVRRIIQLP
jgi:lysophospholipase L1-like esterase